MWHCAWWIWTLGLSVWHSKQIIAEEHAGSMSFLWEWHGWKPATGQLCECLLSRLCLWYHFYRESNIHHSSLFYCPFPFLFPLISFFFFLSCHLSCRCHLIFLFHFPFSALFLIPFIIYCCCFLLLPFSSFLFMFCAFLLSFSFCSDPFNLLFPFINFPVLLFPPSPSCFVIFYFLSLPLFSFLILFISFSSPFHLSISFFPFYSDSF